MYADTLKYLYEHLPMFSHIGSDAYKKDLANTRTTLRSIKQSANKI